MTANIHAGARALRQKIDEVGSIRDGVRAYNGSGPLARKYAYEVYDVKYPKWKKKFAKASDGSNPKANQGSNSGFADSDDGKMKPTARSLHDVGNESSSDSKDPNQFDGKSKRYLAEWALKNGVITTRPSQAADIKNDQMDGRFVGLLVYLCANGWKMTITAVKSDHRPGTNQ